MIYISKNIVSCFLGLALLSPLLVSCFGQSAKPKTIEGIKVTVDTSSVLSTSQFATGITLTDTRLHDPTQQDNAGVVAVQSLIKNAMRYENTHIMAWGLDNPWPDPAQSEPTNWAGLDSRLQLIRDTRGTPVITLSEAPWWMKGQLQPDGTTRVLTQRDEHSEKLYFDSRVLDNKMSAWLHLVQRIAERYMKPPYNVRYFQVWNELKGYHNPVSNEYDYDASPGDPRGANAKHGYTYMYNQVYDTLMQTATGLGIATESVQVGGPYAVIDTWSSAQQDTASNFSKAYGVYDRRALDAVKYWLQYKHGAGFITLDASNENRDNRTIASPFSSAEMFADVVRWVRSLDPNVYQGATTLPIWWAEWYAHPGKRTNSDYDNAVKATAMIHLVRAGGAVALMWGGDKNSKFDYGIWTDITDRGDGGKPQPWYYSYKALNDYFASGTALRKTTVTHPDLVEVLASPDKIMLVNKTENMLMLTVNDKPVSLNPYKVSVLDYNK